MNPRSLLKLQGSRWCCAALLALSLPASTLLAAEPTTPAAETAAPVSTNAPAKADANAPAEEAAKAAEPLTPEQLFEGGTKTFNNWVQFSAGGFMTSGSRPQFEQQHQTSSGAFGGIEDLHVQGDITKGTTFTIDGHSVFDNHDYDLTLGVAREKLG